MEAAHLRNGAVEREREREKSTLKFYTTPMNNKAILVLKLHKNGKTNRAETMLARCFFPSSIVCHFCTISMKLLSLWHFCAEKNVELNFFRSCYNYGQLWLTMQFTRGIDEMVWYMLPDELWFEQAKNSRKKNK